MTDTETGPGLDEILMAARRRAGLVALVFLLGSALAVTAASMLPPVYSATARIMVEGPQIPDALARSTVTAPAAERLKRLEQRLTTRKTLLEVAEAHGLFDGRPGLAPEKQAAAMRQAISIEPITVGDRRRGTTTVSAFTISYRAADPALAAAVANDLAARLLGQNRAERAARTRETSAFFQAEADRLKGEIAEAERRIAAFRAEHGDRLPEADETRQAELQALRNRNAARERRRKALEQQLRRLQADNPLDGARVRQASADGAALPGGGASGRARQIRMAQTRLDFLDRLEQADRTRQTALEAAAAAAPGVELALAALYREHDLLREQAQMVVARQTEAATGERLEQNRQAERFEVIEQAVRPAESAGSRRRLVATGGVFGSLALGLVFAGLLEAARGTVLGPRELERRTGLRPIVTVPWIPTAAEARQRRRRAARAAAMALMAGLLLLLAIDRAVTPLPMLADTVMTRIGSGVPVPGW